VADDVTWYVVPTDGGWLVTERTRGGGKVVPTKEIAIATAAALAQASAPAGYQVRRANGSIEREVRFEKGPPRRNRRTPPEAPSSMRRRRAARLLLVDDDPLVRSSFGRLLSARGWEVILAEDCREAEVALASDVVFAAIIDLGLPGSVELAEALLLARRATKVVFFTGQPPDAHQNRTEALGLVVVKGSPGHLFEALRPDPEAAPAEG
jgi:CheY-like chemotaxis protein